MRARHALVLVLTLIAAISFTACSSMPQTKYDLACDLQEDGDYAKAVAQYKAFIGENKYPALNPYAQYNIGACYAAAKGKKDQAMAAFKEVIAKYPQSEVAKWAEADIARLAKRIEINPGAPAPKKAPAK